MIYATLSRLNSDWHLYTSPPSDDEVAIILDGDERGRVFVGEDAHLFFSNVDGAVAKLALVAERWEEFLLATGDTMAAFTDGEVMVKTGWTGTEAQFVHWAISKYGYGAFSLSSQAVIEAAQFACSPEGHKPKSGAMRELKKAVAAYNERSSMTTLNDFQNETWEDEDGNTVEQVVGNSGVYLVVTDKDGTIIRDDRPWQMREGLS